MTLTQLLKSAFPDHNYWNYCVIEVLSNTKVIADYFKVPLITIVFNISHWEETRNALCNGRLPPSLPISYHTFALVMSKDTPLPMDALNTLTNIARYGVDVRSIIEVQIHNLYSMYPHSVIEDALR